MFQFEIDLKAGREAERFDTAVYRFLELHASSLDDMDLVKIDTHPAGQMQKKTVTLWSPQALAEFEHFWARVRRA